MQPAYPRLLIMSTLRRHLWACCINKDRFYLNHWFGHCVWLSCDERGYCKNMTRVSFLRYNCSMKLTVRNWWLSAFDGRQPLPQVRSPAFLCLRNVVVWGLKKTPPQYWGCLSSTVLFRIHLACWDGPALIFLGAPLDLSGNSVQKHAGGYSFNCLIQHANFSKFGGKWVNSPIFRHPTRTHGDKRWIFHSRWWRCHDNMYLPRRASFRMKSQLKQCELLLNPYTLLCVIKPDIGWLENPHNGGLYMG